MDPVEHDWESFEPQVEDRIDEADVNIGEENGRLEGQFEWSGKALEKVGRGWDALRVDLALAAEVLVASQLAKTLGALVEDVRFEGLRKQSE